MRKEEYRAYLKSDYWQQVKKAVRARDFNFCSSCNRHIPSTSGIWPEVHHTSYVDDKGRSIVGRELDYLDRLHLLCNECHRELHKPLTLAELQERIKRLKA